MGSTVFIVERVYLGGTFTTELPPSIFFFLIFLFPSFKDVLFILVSLFLSFKGLCGKAVESAEWLKSLQGNMFIILINTLNNYINTPSTTIIQVIQLYSKNT